MILDKQNALSEAQVVTASAVSTNTIDLGAKRDIGAGEELSVSITVDVSAAAAGAATVDFQIISSAAANLGSPTVLGATGPIGKADLAAGRKPIELKIPRHILASMPIGQRYLGVQYVVATGPLTTGSAFSAYVVKDFQDMNMIYPSGFSLT